MRRDFDMGDLFPPDANPTTEQAEWGVRFLALFNEVNQKGHGAGKTWFWRRVVAMLQKEGEG